MLIIVLPYQFNTMLMVQDCSISSALAMEILQSCIKPSAFPLHNDFAGYFAVVSLS